MERKQLIEPINIQDEKPRCECNFLYVLIVRERFVALLINKWKHFSLSSLRNFYGL